MPTDEQRSLTLLRRSLIVINFVPVAAVAAPTPEGVLSVGAASMETLLATLRDAARQSADGQSVVVNCAFTVPSSA